MQLIGHVWRALLVVFIATVTWIPSPIAARPIQPDPEFEAMAESGTGSLGDITQFPFIVQVIVSRAGGPEANSAAARCGGTIIGDDIVLTAAFCVRHVPAIPSDGNFTITVIASETRWNGSGPRSQSREVKEIRVHPNFTSISHGNDLAVLILVEGFVFSDVVKPLELPDEGQYFIGDATAAGWGHLGRDETNELRKTDLPLVPGSNCTHAYNGSSLQFNRTIMLCAGGAGGDICPGDNGGPLVCTDHAGQKFLCGIISWGQACGFRDRKPSIFTRVSGFRYWIETQILENNRSKSNHSQLQDVQEPARVLESVRKVLNSTATAAVNTIWDLIG